jgi:heme oxygenase
MSPPSSTVSHHGQGTRHRVDGWIKPGHDDLANRDSPVSPRFALRAATAGPHERLHHVPAFAALASGRIDHAAYIALLLRLHGFHVPMEAAIASGLHAAAFAPRLSGWRRAALLGDDLRALGASEAAISRAPMLADLGAAPTAAHALGWLYVVEGSTLGGRMLARRLDHVVRDGGPRARMFLLAGSDPHHVSWTELCRVIDEVGADHDRLTAMILAATQAFEYFETWFVVPPAVGAA